MPSKALGFFFFLIIKKVFLFIYFWLLWVCIAMCRLLSVVASLVADHGLQGEWTSIVVAHRLSCPVACRIFPNQGLNMCPLHWQANSQPLDHQESPASPRITLFRALRRMRRGMKLHETDLLSRFFFFFNQRNKAYSLNIRQRQSTVRLQERELITSTEGNEAAVSRAWS